MSKCRFCDGETEYFDTAKVMNEEAKYNRCVVCESVQVENPHWLAKAHKLAISNYDTGLVARNLIVSKLIAAVLRLNGYQGEKILDWGGGTGLLTRLMRDIGINCYSYDPYCVASICPDFQLKKIDETVPFKALIAVETIEHLEKPGFELSNFARNVSFVFLTTETLPSPTPQPQNRNWWYYLPESGQHVTFASELGMRFFLIRLNFPHLFKIGNLFIGSKDKLNIKSRIILSNRILRNFFIYVPLELDARKKSLIHSDQEELMKALE